VAAAAGPGRLAGCQWQPGQWPRSRGTARAAPRASPEHPIITPQAAARPLGKNHPSRSRKRDRCRRFEFRRSSPPANDPAESSGRFGRRLRRGSESPARRPLDGASRRHAARHQTAICAFEFGRENHPARLRASPRLPTARRARSPHSESVARPPLGRGATRPRSLSLSSPDSTALPCSRDARRRGVRRTRTCARRSDPSRAEAERGLGCRGPSVAARGDSASDRARDAASERARRGSRSGGFAGGTGTIASRTAPRCYPTAS